MDSVGQLLIGRNLVVTNDAQRLRGIDRTLFYLRNFRHDERRAAAGPCREIGDVDRQGVVVG